MGRRSRIRAARWLGALLLAQGCAHAPVQVEVPPRIALSTWPAIGIVEFRNDAEPEFASLATSQFIRMLQAAQPGTAILELGGARRVLEDLARGELDPATARAIGERFGLDAVFVGELVLDGAKPGAHLGEAFESIDARAVVTGRLATRLLEARSGATVWSDSSSASAPFARFGLADGVGPFFDVTDSRDARLEMVRQLVWSQRYDFYPSWRDE